MVPAKPQLRGFLLLVAVTVSQCVGTRAQQGEYVAQADGVMMNVTTSTLSTRTSTTTTATTTTSTTTAKPDRAREAFRELSEKMTRIATREFYPVISELIYDPNISPSCIGSLMKIGTALRTVEIWAVQMIDAMGRPPAGMMQGRLNGYGAYDQCLAVRHNEGIFQGKYCMVHLLYNGSAISPSVGKLVKKFSKHLGFEGAGNVSRMMNKGFRSVAPLYKFGVCVPSPCEPEDLQAIMDHLTKNFGVTLKAQWCAIEEPVKLDQRQTLILSILGVWVSFILFGTSYDFYKTMLWGDEYTDSAKTAAGYVSRAVRAFSLRRAVKKLLHMPNWGDYSNELGFVHGMRVFSATWVVLGHSHAIRDPYANSNFVSLFKRLHDDFLFTVQANSFMAVETFLVITGFLSGYLVSKAPRVNLSPIMVIFVALFRRYVRFIVPLMTLLGFIYLIPAMVDGPAVRDWWPVFERPCTKNWWKILTMTENYFDNFMDLCLPHYWYIAVDYQLAIFTTVILAVITPRWPKASLWLMVFITAATCLATGIQVYVKDALPFNLVVTTDITKVIEMQTEIYVKAYTHAPPLFVGLIFGCLAARRHRLSWLVQAAAWLVAATVSLAALLGVRTWTVGRQPERLESAIYAGLHRASWGLGVAWVMYACATKRGGFVNKILAWPIFYPLGRLSFSLYLVHLILMTTNSALSREFFPQQPFLHAQMYISIVITSYVFASIVYLLIECPVAALDNLVFHRLMPKETILKVMQGKATAQELKAVQALADGNKKKPLDLPVQQKKPNELPDFTKLNHNDQPPCYVNSACESDCNEDTQANGAVISVKF